MVEVTVLLLLHKGRMWWMVLAFPSYSMKSLCLLHSPYCIKKLRRRTAKKLLWQMNRVTAFSSLREMQGPNEWIILLGSFGWNNLLHVWAQWYCKCIGKQHMKCSCLKYCRSSTLCVKFTKDAHALGINRCEMSVGRILAKKKKKKDHFSLIICAA